MKSSRQWAREIFTSVRGRDACDGSEADRWVVTQMERCISRIKREAFAAGADRFKVRQPHITGTVESLRIGRLRFRESGGG